MKPCVASCSRASAVGTLTPAAAGTHRSPNAGVQDEARGLRRGQTSPQLRGLAAPERAVVRNDRVLLGDPGRAGRENNGQRRWLLGVVDRERGSAEGDPGEVDAVPAA